MVTLTFSQHWPWEVLKGETIDLTSTNSPELAPPLALLYSWDYVPKLSVEDTISAEYTTIHFEFRVTEQHLTYLLLQFPNQVYDNII